MGKTTIAAALPNSLLIDCENGSDFISACKVKVTRIGELTILLDEIKKQGKPYKYLIIDTIDKVEDWCVTSATTLYKMSVQGKSFTGSNVLTLPNGGGYLWLRIAFHQIVEKIEGAADTIILLGHVRDKMLEDAGKEVSAKDLDLTGKIKSIVCAWADAICLIDRNSKGELIVSFKTDNTVLCGARASHLKGNTFTFTSPEATEEDWKKIFID